MTKRQLLILSFVVLVCASPALGQPVPADQVVAVVEDEAIFLSEVDQAVKQILFQQGRTRVTDAEQAKLRQDALQELINNKLVLAQANRLGIAVSFSEVEEMVDRAIEQNVEVLGGQEGFERQLEAEGLTMTDLKALYREQIRNRMIVERVIAREIDRGAIEASEDEIRKIYDERKSKLPYRPAVVRLATIFFSFGASTDAKAAARAEIDEIARKAAAGPGNRHPFTTYCPLPNTVPLPT